MSDDRRLETSAQVGDGPVASTGTVVRKPETGTLEVAFRELEGAEGIAMGFRQQMFDLGGRGGVSTGAGMGTEFILLEWGEKQVMVRGLDLLRAWVAQIDPEAVKRFPGVEDVYG